MFTLKTALCQYLIRSTHYNFIRHLAKDPGIGLRKELLSRIDEKELELPDFDDLESDFMDVDKSHKDHLRQVAAVKERDKFFLVQQKYFKERFPNFLTWHDKEQIRFLHRTDPEQWTLEKLSEGFPALPETIKKIIKSNWTKHKPQKITNHDKSVQKNWELFKCGKMKDLPPELKEHLNKFTNRALNFNAFVSSNTQKQVFNVKENNIKSEFSEIITSYERLKTNNAEQIEENETTIKTQHKSPLITNMKPSSRKSMLTLEELQENLNKKLETVGNLVDDEEKVIVMSLKSQKDNVAKGDADVITNLQSPYQRSTSVQLYEKPVRELSHLNYPEKISIPKGILKKGSIYKLNDCYYDDDGEFLYRVPGMG